MLKRYCTTPCTFYGYESNYKFCKACDGSDKKLLEDWMRREKEKRLYIQQMNEVNSWIENDPITKKVIDDVSKMVADHQRDMIDYCKRDVEETIKLYNRLHRGENDMNYTAFYKIGGRTIPGYLAIEKVHFSGPVTVVIWNDHTKTVVRCQDGEDFDPEKGLAMAISKKMFGNKGSYFDVFKEWIPEEEKAVDTECVDVKAIAESFERAGAIACKTLNKAFGGTCETCKYKDVLGYKWPCVKCNHGSKWKVKENNV